MSIYNIRYSDQSKTAIPVNTGTINNNTVNIALVGRNAPGFGAAMAENFLHLLENFAGPVAPSSTFPGGSPVEGQLWYDTSDQENKVLRINNGTGLNRFSPELGGVFRAANDTPPQNARVGDIWVNTTYNQVNVWNGSSFTLVGPLYSSTYQQGPYPETIYGTDGQQYAIIKNYINGDAITIIAQDSFRPAAKIDGFDLLVPGVNLSTSVFNNISPTFNGVATQASSLRVTVPTTQSVAANNFFRKDLPESLSEVLNINNNGGLSIGLTSSTFLLTKQARDAVITNTAPDANILFSIEDSTGVRNSIVTVAGQTKRVGINQLNPAATLDVVGNLQVSSNAVLFSNLSVTGTVYTSANVQIGTTLSVFGTSNFAQTITVPSIEKSGSSAIIGKSTAPFDAVYATYIEGTSFSGNSTTASRLAQRQTFSVKGHVYTTTATNFNGTAEVSLDVKLSQKAINEQPTTSTAATSFTLPISDPTNSNLFKITKQNFLADVTPKLVSVGFIMSTSCIVDGAGVIRSDPPTGWLWCDGSSKSASGIYTGLWSSLMATVPQGAQPPYGSTGPGSFNVPNLPIIFPTNVISTSTAIAYMIKY